MGHPAPMPASLDVPFMVFSRLVGRLALNREGALRVNAARYADLPPAARFASGSAHLATAPVRQGRIQLDKVQSPS